MFTVLKVLLMSRATVILCVWGVILLNPLTIVLLMLCSAMIVEWMFVYVYCIESLAQVHSYSNCTWMGCHLIESPG